MSHIIIADAHSLYRDALCRFIREFEQGFQITDCSSHDEIKLHCANRETDLILIASDLPGAQCADTPKLGKTGLIVKCMDTQYDASSYAGVFPKTLSGKDFIAGIHKILMGHFFVPNIITTPPVHPKLKDPAHSIHHFSLSPREKEVLCYLAKGNSNKDIARALDLQVVTIKLHVRGVCRKLGVSNRTQAALMAKEYGWT